jgi:hypothetical protein
MSNRSCPTMHNYTFFPKAFQELHSLDKHFLSPLCYNTAFVLIYSIFQRFVLLSDFPTTKGTGYIS